MQHLISTLVFLGISICSFGQQAKLSKKSYLEHYKIYKSQDNSTSDVETFFSDHKSRMGLTIDDEMVLMKSEAGRNGYEHDRYKQVYKGIPVYGVSYNLHSKNGKVISANGSYLPNINIDTDFELSHNDALQIAQNDMNAAVYSWAESEDIVSVPAEKPVPDLVIIDRAMPRVSGSYVLCLRLKLYSTKPLAGKEYFIDANTGELISKLELLHDHSVPGTGTSKYYGEVDITIDSISPQKFALIDSTRGADGITVSSPSVSHFESNINHFDLMDEENNEVAVDGFWCTARFYDMLKDEFDWLGLDNNDKSFNVGIRANDQQDYLNAFWNGTMAWFGNGDCNHGPLTTLEVVGHEFMHGVIDHTSNLLYRNESGAINESLADVIGKMLEHRFDPDNFKWQIGHSFIVNPAAEPFRFMSDPHRKEHPAYYKGEYWFDYSGVHTNSSIGNLWFYYLSEGGQGIHEGGFPFDVDALGIEEAAKFIFFTNRFYLTENSDYNDYYQSSLLAAEEFFNGSTEIIDNIEAAWNVVGLPNEPVGVSYDLAVIGDGGLECAKEGTYLPIKFTIVNNGDLPYSPDMNARIITEFDNNFDEVEHVYQLSQELLPGEEITITLDSLLLVGVTDFVWVTHNIVFSLDEQADNNEDDSFISLIFHEKDNLVIHINSVTGDCFTDDIRVVGSISNWTCTPLESGLVVGLIVRNASNNEMLYEGEIEITETINQFRFFSIDEVLELELLESTELEFEIVYDQDVDNSDNIYTISYNKVHTIDNNYSNRFSNESDLEKDIFVETNEAVDPIYFWSSNSYFITTGEDVDFYSPLCLEFDRNWDGIPEDFNKISATIKMCVDLSNIESPELNFNLVQFRNSETFATEESSSLRVSWSNDAFEGNEVINGLTEGVITNQQIGLPSNFKGELEFRFLENVGLPFFSGGSVLNYDASLLDNIQFRNSVSTEEQIEEIGLVLFPNPSSENLSIATSAIFDYITISDLNGRLLKKDIFKTMLDISDLESGYYILELGSKDKLNIRKSFLKL